jgi:ribonuclease HII
VYWWFHFWDFSSAGFLVKTMKIQRPLPNPAMEPRTKDFSIAWQNERAKVSASMARAGTFWHRLGLEQELWRAGTELVAGVDEAGCGPLAGPVVAGAVVFPRAWLEAGLCSKLRGLNDSKMLSEEEREKFYDVIVSHPDIRHAVVVIDVETIDRINIRQAAWRGMNQALDQIQPRPQHVLVDGLKIKWLPYPQTAVVKGDAKSYSIAAASVLAKVTRDRLMREYDRMYPGYGFAVHKGYATPQHNEAITKLGACPIHRRSFAPFRAVEEELELFALDSPSSRSPRQNAG